LSVSVVECEAGIQRGDESWRLRSITYQSAVFNVQRERKCENVFGRPQSSCRPDVIINFVVITLQVARRISDMNQTQPNLQNKVLKLKIVFIIPSEANDSE
jgi:hypothetical protein